MVTWGRVLFDPETRWRSRRIAGSQVSHRTFLVKRNNSPLFTAYFYPMSILVIVGRHPRQSSYALQSIWQTWWLLPWTFAQERLRAFNDSRKEGFIPRSNQRQAPHCYPVSRLDFVQSWSETWGNVGKVWFSPDAADPPSADAGKREREKNKEWEKGKGEGTLHQREIPLESKGNFNGFDYEVWAFNRPFLYSLALVGQLKLQLD